ncbi:MAG: beta-N-acetylhexosaminidase [Eubacteriales bacterium]|nr:beta-N-acetylhexosaminidase [Eubacteriales bacterium]
MKFRLEQLQEELGAGTEILLKKYGHELADSEEGAFRILPTMETVPALSVRKKGKAAVIRYPGKAQFFRGLSRLLSHLKEQNWEMREAASMEQLGAMLDCSRNGVLRTETVKRYIRIMAELGMNQLMLYTEDTYEIPEYPSFGAFRGRYTAQEIRECDAYAEIFGIELVPCIQTLAHLHTPLRWPVMQSLQDNEDILMAGEERTQKLIDAMLASVSRMFRSRKVHLGMDEAFYLGLGNYLRKNGFQDRTTIMKRHLDTVTALCRKYGLEPMIWSDMYFSLASENGDYYGVSPDYEWREEDKPPKDLTLVYWDYYHHDSAVYEKMLRLHKRLSDKICFAGGGWTWNGLSPNYKKAQDTTAKAFLALKEQGITSAFCTFWQDNGAETPMEAGLLSLVYFAECAYRDEITDRDWKERWEQIFDSNFEGMLLLDRLDRVPGTGAHNENQANPSKWLLYQDPMLGLFDGQIEGQGVGEYYEQLAQRLGNAAKKDKEFYHLLSYYELLARFLGKKAELGIHILKAYQDADKEELWRICEDVIGQARREIQALKERREVLWFAECKPQGYEVLDIRLSGVDTRLQSAARRIQSYLNGKEERLEELEEERILWQSDREGQRVIPRENMWEFIVSAANIKGV